jgi:hypothetical protein
MLCPHSHQKMKQVNFKAIKCVSLDMENKKELKGTSYMIVLFIRLFLGQNVIFDEKSLLKGWKHGQKNQGCQGKNPFPRTTHDMCHFFVDL